MKIGFYAGSFDPFTNGHLHVVKEAAGLFDKLYIGIGINGNKKRVYNQNEMCEVILKSLKDSDISNVDVIVYEGLTVDCAKEVGANYFVRGIRNGMDYQYEENLAVINEEISGINTIYIRAGKYGMVSSSFVRELVNNQKDVSKYVPDAIFKYMEKKI